MNRFGRFSFVIGLVIIAVVAVAYTLFGRADNAAPVMADFTERDAVPRFIVSDSHGAILEAGSTASGVSRTSGKTWSRNSGTVQGFTCATACPAAVLSGDGEDLTADAAPASLGDAALPASWLTATGGSNNILDASTSTPLRFVSTQPGKTGYLEDATGKKTPLNILAAYWTSLRPDRTAGVLKGQSPNGRYISIPMVRNTHGWSTAQDGVADTEKQYATVCLSARAETRVINGVVTRGGTTVTHVQGSTEADCVFAGDSLVSFDHVAQVSGGAASGSSQTHIHGVDLTSGRTTWTLSFPTDLDVVGSPTAHVIALSDPISHIVRLVDTARGTTYRTFQGKTAATFDEQGELLLADTSGGVQWTKP